MNITDIKSIVDELIYSPMYDIVECLCFFLNNFVFDIQFDFLKTVP